MYEYKSFMRTYLLEYIEYRTACDSWHEHSGAILQRIDYFLRTAYPEWQALTQRMVDEWCSKKESENAITWAGRVAQMRVLLRFLENRGYISGLSVPDASDVCYSASARRPPNTLSFESISRFFKACDNLRGYRSSTRYHMYRRLIIPVLFRMLYSTGMRPCEARHLTTDDVDLSEGVLLIRNSKNGDGRLIALHPSMTELMARYDAAMAKICPLRNLFFPNWDGGTLKRSFIIENFKSIWHSCNAENATAYDFRHNFATANINSWIGLGDGFHDRLVYLSKYMGHSKLESTAYYYSVVPALAGILESKCEEALEDIIPEVDYE